MISLTTSWWIDDSWTRHPSVYVVHLYLPDTEVQGLQWDCCVQGGKVGGWGCSQLSTRGTHAHRRQNSLEITSNSCAGRWGEGGRQDELNNRVDFFLDFFSFYKYRRFTFNTTKCVGKLLRFCPTWHVWHLSGYNSGKKLHSSKMDFHLLRSM